MNTNRLHQQPAIFCEMFAGWKLYRDISLLLKLQEGDLLIDILNRISYCNGQPLDDAFAIAGEIADWFGKDLLEHNMDQTAIQEAVLHVHFSATSEEETASPGNMRITEVYMRMHAAITVDEKVFAADRDESVAYRNTVPK